MRLPVFGVPQPHRFAPPTSTRTCDCVAIGTERYAIDTIRMPCGAVRMRLPVLASHSRTVLSPQLPLALAIVSPSGLNDTLVIQPVCLIVRMRLPVLASHSHTVPSPKPPLPLAIVFPSGLNDTLLKSSVCPKRVRRWLPVSTSHKRTVLS